MPDQLPLFDTAAAPERQAAADSPLDARFAALRETASRLSPHVRFGTSSWAFPGWSGLVYGATRSERWLSREGLRECVRHPLFRTVGIDRSYYARIPDEDLRRYADQLPEGFPCCCKAPARVTSAVVPERGAKEANPHFLSAGLFIDDLLEPVSRLFGGHAGPFVLQFPSMLRRSGLEPNVFIDALDEFLFALPREFHYAVELRDRSLLTPAYARVLTRHGAGHVYNLWTAMPMPAEQVDLLPPETMPFVMVRLLLRPGATYDEQRETFAPFDRIAAPLEQMREEVLGIVARAVARAIPAYVLVNNKAEGSAPLTIEALALRLALEGSGLKTQARVPEPPEP
jgi:uncharacterized protein YecE (DUF72 family)